MQHRKIFIGGNWKCNGTVSFVKEFGQFLSTITFDDKLCEVAIAPTYLHLQSAKEAIPKSMYVCAQNISKFEQGAYTGEIHANQLKDIGIDWTLIGHSERRTYFHEDEKVIAEKLQQAFKYKVNVILCIGERLEEREASKTFEVIENQMKTSIENCASNWDNVVIAYEPVWAIGTGKTATPEQAQEVHEHIRKIIKEKVSVDVSNKVRIIYGGSVTEKNCDSLIEKVDIDGFLVGGASLKPAFKTIIESYKKSK